MSRSIRAVLLVMAAAAAPIAHADCSVPIARAMQALQGDIAALRADKPGQMRVRAANGAEFSAGQLQWMRGRLRRAEHACTRGDEPEAQAALQGLRQLLPP